MIEISRVEVSNLANALYGMRLPMNSNKLSDSECLVYNKKINNIETIPLNYVSNIHKVINVKIGEKDENLAKKLIIAGSEHRKFLRMINVSFVLTASQTFFSQFDTYKIGTVANSTSKMHKLMSKPFVPDMFSLEDLRGYKKVVEQKPNVIDEKTELWKKFPLNENYEVSNQGRIKRKEITLHNRTLSEKILTNTITSDGYFKVGVKINNIQKDKRVHQLVGITWLDNPNQYKEINHINGNKLDNRVENLEWCNSSQNQFHAINNHLQPNRVKNYEGKLTKEQRDKIKSEYKLGNITQRELGEKYKVSHSVINAIVNKKYNYGENVFNEYDFFLETLEKLNNLREEWLITHDKKVWDSLLLLLPMSFLQTRTISLNYEVIYNIIHQRKNHKLKDWETFINYMKELPYSDILLFIDFNNISTGEENEK